MLVVCEKLVGDGDRLLHSDPQLSSPARMQKKCNYGQKNLGSICSSLSPSPTNFSHTTNINPFKNKVWEIYFYKEVCSFVRSLKFVIIVDYVSAYICICICIMSIQHFPFQQRLFILMTCMFWTGRYSHNVHHIQSDSLGPVGKGCRKYWLPLGRRNYLRW